MDHAFYAAAYAVLALISAHIAGRLRMIVTAARWGEESENLDNTQFVFWWLVCLSASVFFMILVFQEGVYFGGIQS